MHQTAALHVVTEPGPWWGDDESVPEHRLFAAPSPVEDIPSEPAAHGLGWRVTLALFCSATLHAAMLTVPAGTGLEPGGHGDAAETVSVTLVSPETGTAADGSPALRAATATQPAPRKPSTLPPNRERTPPAEPARRPKPPSTPETRTAPQPDPAAHPHKAEAARSSTSGKPKDSAKPPDREPVAAERDDSHSAEPDSAKPKATRKKTPGETKAASTNSRPKANSEAPKAVEAAPAERTSTRDRQLNKEGTGPKPAAKSPSRRTASTARARPARPDPAETRPTQRESGAASRRSADGDAQHSSTADTTATPAALVAPKFHAPGLDNPAPRYPPLARRRGIEGEVLLKVKVSAEGEPVAVRVVQSSGTALLDRAARNTVAKWHFRPARRGDTAVAASVEVPLAFRLTGG